MRSNEEETTPSHFMMPSTGADPVYENPIRLAKTPVSRSQLSTEIQFEENLFE